MRNRLKASLCKTRFVFLSVVWILFLPTLANSEESKIFKHWVEAKNKNQVLPLPDFSYSGYEHGESEVPVATGKVFKVEDYGALPNDEKSDREALEKCIAAASQESGKVIIQFGVGVYRLNEEGDSQVPIKILRGDLVLKGMGVGTNGTILFMAKNRVQSDPAKLWSTEHLIDIGSKDSDWKNSGITKIIEDVEKDSFVIKVESVKELSEGQFIQIKLASVEAAEFMIQPYALDPAWKAINTKGLDVRERHQIKKIEGNLLTLVEPVLGGVKVAWNPVVTKTSMVSNVGIEDIWFRGNWHSDFVHHRSPIDDFGWSPIKYQTVVNGWVRRCRFTDVNETLVVNTSRSISVYQILVDGNSGHCCLPVHSSTGVWVGLLSDRSTPGMWHGPGVADSSAGNVFWKMDCPGTSSPELHASQPYATLFDQLSCGLLNGHQGGSVEALPNHLHDLVFWNYEQRGASKASYEFWQTDSKYGRVYKPLMVGFHGGDSTFKEIDLQYLESLGEEVTPKSLWLAQMKYRLGSVPEWVGKIEAEWSGLLPKWLAEPVAPLN